MGLCRISYSLFWVLGLGIVSNVVFAQDSPQDYLDAHNAARSEVSVPDLVWDDNVAAFAQNYANQRKGDCQMVHSGGGDQGYGENLAGGTGDLSATDAVAMWVNEKANYDYNSNSCIGGECRHYTLVVWQTQCALDVPK